MPTKDEILSELGLGPAWRLRDFPGLAADSALVAREPAPSAPPPTVDPAQSEARVVRIANLDWGSFAADVDA